MAITTIIMFMLGTILLSIGGAFYSSQKRYSMSTPVTEKGDNGFQFTYKYIVNGNTYSKGFEKDATYKPYKDTNVMWYNPKNPDDATIIDPWVDINGVRKAPGKNLLIAGGVIMGILILGMIYSYFKKN
jgi:hypothetical protein